MILEFKAERKCAENPFSPPHFTNEEAEGQVCSKPWQSGGPEFHSLSDGEQRRARGEEDCVCPKPEKQARHL